MATCLRVAASAKAGNAAGGFSQHSPNDLLRLIFPHGEDKAFYEKIPDFDAHFWLFPFVTSRKSRWEPKRGKEDVWLS
jgi:hypothetical protein